MQSLKRLQNETLPIHYPITRRTLARITLACALLLTHYVLLPLVEFIGSVLALPEVMDPLND